MKILVTGANGQLGRELLKCSNNLGFVSVGLNRDELDIQNIWCIQKAIEEYEPDCLINTAAYTSVDKAESESELAFAINETAVSFLAKCCKDANIPLVHFSSDYVFSGNKSGLYSEENHPEPINIYGKSKLAGEYVLQQECEKFLIFRTSWVFSMHGNNFLKTMLRLGTQNESLSVIADQFGKPTSASELARVCLETLRNKNLGQWGTYHLAQPEITNWHEFSKVIFDKARLLGFPLKMSSLSPISTDQFPSVARRPANSALDCSLLEKTFNLSIKPWSVSVEEVILDLLENTPILSNS